MRIRACRALVTAVCLVACSKDSPTEPVPVEANPGRRSGAPPGWTIDYSASYTVGVQVGTARTGDSAAYLATRMPVPTGLARLTQVVAADAYRGRRLRLSGWVRPTDVTGTGAGLWMRVDSPNATLAFDDMLEARPILGTSEWREVSIVLDIPERAVGIAFGALHTGGGTIVVDDLRLEVVDAAVASTDMLDAPIPIASADVVWYTSAPPTPHNLGFEGIDPLPAATIAWLREALVRLESAEPGSRLDDLDPLRQMVGDARIVGLGEGTHGTREFFLLKHRMLEYLVERMGFTHFAMETSWAEALEINHYVLTGEGDPSALLRKLGFWTWDTGEVLEMIRWMRRWNETAPPERRVQFHGFDPQLMGTAAIDTLRAAAQRVSPHDRDDVARRTECMWPHVGAGIQRYERTPPQFRTECQASLAAVATWVEDNRAAIEANSHPGAIHYVRQSARVLQQLEHLASPVSDASARDSAMAENVRWLEQQVPAGSGLVLWAHNAHVAKERGWMGDYLRRYYGAQYVNAGFLFGRGGFNAVVPASGLRATEANEVPPYSLEAAFLGTGVTTALLDLGLLESGGDASAPLRAAIPMRSIGSLFDPALETAYFRWTIVPEQFDLLLYVSQGTPTLLR